jgi:hypothetical protein
MHALSFEDRLASTSFFDLGILIDLEVLQTAGVVSV